MFFLCWCCFQNTPMIVLWFPRTHRWLWGESPLEELKQPAKHTLCEYCNILPFGQGQCATVLLTALAQAPGLELVCYHCCWCLLSWDRFQCVYPKGDLEFGVQAPTVGTLERILLSLVWALFFWDSRADPFSSTWGDSLWCVSAFLTKTGFPCSVNLAFVPVSEVILGVGLSPVFGGGGAGYDRHFSASYLGGVV